VIELQPQGTTPYVIGGLQSCNEITLSGSISCNQEVLFLTARFPIDVVVGPNLLLEAQNESGTAKMVLNMISTATMIQLGKVKGNKMVDMH
jgi:N-acetylmuramic acid 6-phosphate etherase